MLRLLPARFPVYCLVLTLGACSSVPERAHSDLASPRQVVIADAISTQSAGALLELPTGNALSVSPANVLHEYQSASGRLCRRVEIPQESSIRVMCERSKGTWSLTRALLGSEGDERLGKQGVGRRSDNDESGGTLVNATADLQASGNRDRQDSVEQQLGEGESLMGFAMRTTGDISNWKLIADLNGIEDPDRIRAGRELAVPSHLFSGQR